MDRRIAPSSGPTCLVALAVVLCAAGAGPAAAMDPARGVSRYGLEVWTGRNGLPGEAVYRVAQTPDGYLWMRTNAGVCRFDGVRFTPLELAVGAEPIREIPRSFCLGADGSPLIRTATRTLRLRRGSLVDAAEPGPPERGVAGLLFESSAGRIWVGGDCSLGVVRQGKLQEVRPGTGVVNAFLEGRGGDLWVGTTSGLFRYRGDRQVNELPDFAPIDDVHALAADREGALWVGTSWGLFRVVEGRPPERLDVPGISGRSVTAILQDRDGSMWVGTNSTGLFRRSGTHWEGLRARDGLASDNVLSLLEDREGSLWVGTDGGLCQLRDTKLQVVGTREGLPLGDVYAVLAARDGVVYATTSLGLVRLGDGPPRVYTEADGLPNNYTLGLSEGRDGSIWVGTAKGLAQLKDGRIRSHAGIGPTGESCVTAVVEDDRGLLLFSADKPPQCLRGWVGGEGPPAEITPVAVPEALRHDYFFTACRGADGTRWYGSTGGLYRDTGGGLGSATKEPGIGFPVTSIWDDGRGYLWVAGRAPGVMRLRIADGSTFGYTMASGLAEDDLTAVVCDLDGDLWASTPRGVFRVSRRDLDDFARGRRAAVRSIVFGTADGMKTTESTTPEHQPAAGVGPDGRLWFTTRNGLVVVDPRRVADNPAEAPVVIEQVVVDGQPMPAVAEVRTATGASRIEFHYTGLCLRVPERVKFRYKLEGFDPGWVEAGTRRAAYYTNLTPGRYRFRVRACNDDGLWGEAGASVGLFLPPRFEQTTTFKLGCIAFTLVLMATSYRLRMAASRRRERELSRLVRARTAELEEAKAELELRNRRLAELATTDPLTGLCNRRRFLDALAAALRLAERHGGPTSVLMLDVDHFKSYNDTLGHPAGDEALRVVSKVLRDGHRDGDVAARYGGEEFIVLLPGTDTADAAGVAERLRAEIESAPWPHRPVTASVGVATSRNLFVGDLEALIAAADRALYRAKRGGRNRVERAEPDHARARDAAGEPGMLAGRALS